MRRLVLMSVLVLLAAALSGCIQPATPAGLPADAPPELVAQRYFELRANGDEQSARALMWRPERFDGLRDGGLKGLTGLRVEPSEEDTAAYRPDEYRILAEIRLMWVEYVRHRKDDVGNPPGPDGRYVLVGRETEGGPWLIVEIGTGP